MTIDYPVELCIHLRPIGTPWVKISVNYHTVAYQLSSQQSLAYKFDTNDHDCEIVIEHFNKQPDDAHTAVEIVGIDFFNIANDRFAWAGVYTPNYPDLWYNQQLIKPEAILPGQTYLGWNGIYRLQYSVPVFEWMHKTLNLGWIYR